MLVLGGSQGAAALNERIPHAVAKARGRLPDFVVVHQTGRERDGAVRAAYESLGVTGATVTPFLDDVAEQMVQADLVVARAGAVTVAEIAAIGRAAILVPFPHAADDHQAKNALSLEELGAAVCLRQEAADEDRLAALLVELLGEDERRERMAARSREHGRPHAAHDVAMDLLDLAGIRARRREHEGHGANGASKRSVASKEVS